jgi:hypothetical protein
MDYRGPGFFVYLLPHASQSSVSKLDMRHKERLRKRDNLRTGEAGSKELNHTTARKPGLL